MTRSHVEELATLETLDNGKTFVESCEDVNNVADFFDYYSGWCDKFYGDVNPVMGNFFSYTVREPVGVCGQIIPGTTPWIWRAARCHQQIRLLRVRQPLWRLERKRLGHGVRQSFSGPLHQTEIHLVCLLTSMLNDTKTHNSCNSYTFPTDAVHR